MQSTAANPQVVHFKWGPSKGWACDPGRGGHLCCICFCHWAGGFVIPTFLRLGHAHFSLVVCACRWLKELLRRMYIWKLQLKPTVLPRWLISKAQAEVGLANAAVMPHFLSTKPETGSRGLGGDCLQTISLRRTNFNLSSVLFSHALQQKWRRVAECN